MPDELSNFRQVGMRSDSSGVKPAVPHQVPVTEAGSVTAEEGLGDPLHLFLDDIEDYAVFMISLEGSIASWNTGAQKLKGYTTEEAVGRPFAMLFTEKDRAKGLPEREMKHALEHGVYTGEGVRLRKDGTEFEAEVTLRLVRGGDGKPVGFVKVTRDITERRQLQRLEGDRAEFEKQLLGIVSHDLRNPLAAILGSANILLRREGLDRRQMQGLERISSSAQRALRLVSELLDFTQARLGGGLSIHRVRFEIAPFLSQVVEEVRLVHPDHEIIVEGSGAGTVEWDTDRIAQIIINLVNNAVKHGAPNRPVTVRVSASSDEVTIEVHNWGLPIAERILPTLFEPLKQGEPLNETRGSIGLGLFIVRHIVLAHDGRIDVQSSEDKGTSFAVHIPRRGPRTAT